MELAAQIDAVVEVVLRHGVEVRREHLGGGGGGLCTLRGRKVLFIDMDADPATRLEQSLAGMRLLPGVADIFMPPEIRERLDGNLG